MPIPDFTPRGVLPRGLHKCNAPEFFERFCYATEEYSPWHPSGTRDSYETVLHQLFGHSIERGVKSIIFGGSFITNSQYPNDIDCIVIAPTERAIPHKNEFIIMSDCRLDIVYALDENKEYVSKMLNMFSRDRYDLEIGLIEVVLDEKFESSWGCYYGEYEIKDLLEQREAYINRHLIVGSESKRLFVTVHGLNTEADWNFDLAPIASSNNLIFAPFKYGDVKMPLISDEAALGVMDRFRDWIYSITQKYGQSPSVFAHSFGTYIIGQYIKGHNYEPPVKFKNIVLAGSILNPDFDWISGFEKSCCTSVLNVIAPNDPWVDRIKKLKWLIENPLYGTAGTTGFQQEHPRIFSDKIDLYDHCNMMKMDFFENKLVPFLSMAKQFEYSGLNYLSARGLEQIRAESDSQTSRLS